MGDSVKDKILEEKAIRDAGYDGEKNSLSSLGQGSVSGAVVGNLGNSMFSKNKSSTIRKAVGAGAIVGGVANFILNNYAANKARRAKEWLERNKQKEINERLSKESSEVVSDAVMSGATDAAIGAAIPLGGSRKKTAILGAGVGVLESLLSDGIMKNTTKAKDDKTKAVKTGLAVGLAAGVTPAIERAAYHKDKDWARRIADTEVKTGLISKHLGNDKSAAEAALKADSLKGSMRGVGRHMGTRALIGGLLAGGATYGLSKLENKG